MNITYIKLFTYYNTANYVISIKLFSIVQSNIYKYLAKNANKKSFWLFLYYFRKLQEYGDHFY
jgi:hypothetical protein